MSCGPSCSVGARSPFSAMMPCSMISGSAVCAGTRQSFGGQCDVYIYEVCSLL